MTSSYWDSPWTAILTTHSRIFYRALLWHEFRSPFIIQSGRRGFLDSMAREMLIICLGQMYKSCVLRGVDCVYVIVYVNTVIETILWLPCGPVLEHCFSELHDNGRNSIYYRFSHLSNDLERNGNQIHPFSCKETNSRRVLMKFGKELFKLVQSDLANGKNRICVLSSTQTLISKCSFTEKLSAMAS